MLLLYQAALPSHPALSPVFTFHYASTLSSGSRRYPDSKNSFTFHYASTLSVAYFADAYLKIHLHSTMLLLYPSPFDLPRSNVSNLHSTMLLLYHKIQPKNRLPSVVFTFHYASTLSDGVNPLQGQVCHIYIPLCFYFISRLPSQKKRPSPFTFHYASTLSKILIY